jgi:hypothetical protein
MPEPRESAPRPLERWVPVGAGILALVPLIAHHALFARLFWFGDELDLLDRLDRVGVWRWTWTHFAENFVPVFKLLWVGVLTLSGGSYSAEIALLWATHALNVSLLARLMRACGLSWTAVAVATVAFGLTQANFETLAWSVQWSAVLSTTFLLLALASFLSAPCGAASYAWDAASALSFSRGVLTGFLLALACLLPGPGTPRPARRVLGAAGYLLPAVLAASVIAAFGPGNSTHMRGHWEEAASYGAWNFFLNPALGLIGAGSASWRMAWILGAAKIALIAWALSRSGGRARLLFVLLLVFDLGNSALLGVGRYHTGLATAVSSRYQYASLVATMPCAGYVLAELWRRIPVPAGARAAAAALALGGAGAWMVAHWPDRLIPFAQERGDQPRRELLGPPSQPGATAPGVPFMSMERARELTEKYHLH